MFTRIVIVVAVMVVVGCGGSSSKTVATKVPIEAVPVKVQPGNPPEKKIVPVAPDKNPDPPKAVDRTPSTEVNAAVLWSEYGDNEIATDKRYKDKYVKLTGKVKDVKKDESGKYYVSFIAIETGGGLQGPRTDHLPNVICYIDPSKTDDFTGFKERQQITIVAKVVGRKSMRAYEGYGVILMDAHIP